jgi:hypothetical protein
VPCDPRRFCVSLLSPSVPFGQPASTLEGGLHKGGFVAVSERPSVSVSCAFDSRSPVCSPVDYHSQRSALRVSAGDGDRQHRQLCEMAQTGSTCALMELHAMVNVTAPVTAVCVVPCMLHQRCHGVRS